jgi:hypothetical protein
VRGVRWWFGDADDGGRGDAFDARTLIVTTFSKLFPHWTLKSRWFKIATIGVESPRIE